MKSIKYILVYSVLLINFTGFGQYGRQKKADNLFNKFSFVNAAESYKTLIENDYNTDYSIRQLADCYAYMRNPDSAAVYYKKAVENNNVPIEYYYKYAQALRGIKDYKASRIWLKKFEVAGGTLNNNQFAKDIDFINSIFNAKPQYVIKPVNFNSKFSDFGAYEYDNKIYFHADPSLGTNYAYQMVVVEKPVAPNWGYVISGENALFNPNSSINFELHSSEENKLVIKILALAGVAIKDVQLAQVAAAKEASTTQQQKQ